MFFQNLTWSISYVSKNYFEQFIEKTATYCNYQKKQNPFPLSVVNI